MDENYELNPEFTFTNLIVGSSNQFAFAAANSVSKNLGKVYNPLFLYGNVGLGKTHILQSIGHEALYLGMEIRYMTFENFFNDFRKYLATKDMDTFRQKYRTIDLLLLDDIQFIANKKALQEEFFNTLNDLKNLSKQIVLTSDRRPQDLNIEDRIKSRLEGGLNVEVTAPNLTTKREIIENKCKRNNLHLNQEMISYIATSVQDNVRVIEGILLKVNAYSVLMDKDINLDLVKIVVEETKVEAEKIITLEGIITEVASSCNIKPSEMKSKSRNREIVKARRMAIYIARELTELSMRDIAQTFNLKDHTAVAHSISGFKKAMEKDNSLEEEVKLLVNQLK